MPRQTWSIFFIRITGYIDSGLDIRRTDWQKLLDLSDTFYKCKESYRWAKNKDAGIAKKFYHKMIEFAKIFEHKKNLALIARERKDRTILDYCLSGMIDAFLPFNNKFPMLKVLIGRGKTILKLLPEDDPQRPQIEAHLASLQSSA